MRLNEQMAEGYEGHYCAQYLNGLTCIANTAMGQCNDINCFVDSGPGTDFELTCHTGDQIFPDFESCQAACYPLGGDPWTEPFPENIDPSSVEAMEYILLQTFGTGLYPNCEPSNNETNNEATIHFYNASNPNGCPNPADQMVLFPEGIQAGSPNGVTIENAPYIQQFYESAGSPNPGDILRVDIDGSITNEDYRCIEYAGSEVGTASEETGVISYGEFSIQATYVDGPYNSCEECLASFNTEEELCDDLEAKLADVGIDYNVEFNGVNAFCAKCETNSWAPVPEIDQYCECCPETGGLPPDPEGLPYKDPIPNKEKKPFKPVSPTKEKPKKELRESFVRRLQKLANIKTSKK